MLVVSAAFIELAGAKLNADRLKNVFKTSRNFRSDDIACRLEKTYKNIQTEISCNLLASSLCILKSV